MAEAENSDLAPGPVMVTFLTYFYFLLLLQVLHPIPSGSSTLVCSGQKLLLLDSRTLRLEKELDSRWIS